MASARASGASTQLKGVVPDIILPSIFNDAKEFGEQSLENPLDWDTIHSAKFDRLNLVEPYLPELRRRSSARVSADKEFSYIREDIAQFKKQQADKTVSLNEQERLKEKEEVEARLKARDKERLARAETPETIYEVSLKQALLPGLPPPLAKTNLLTAKLSNSKGSPLPAVGTNAAVSAAKDNFGDTATFDDDSAEEKAPAVDADLVESEHILVDYLSLFRKGNLVTTGR